MVVLGFFRVGLPESSGIQNALLHLGVFHFHLIYLLAWNKKNHKLHQHRVGVTPIYHSDSYCSCILISPVFECAVILCGVYDGK